MSLQPPLSPPVGTSLSRFVEGLIASLSSRDFLIRKGRILPVEASSTGAFVLVDCHPEDIFTPNSGPDVAKILQRFAVRAADLRINVAPAQGAHTDGLSMAVIAATYGQQHRLDPSFGLWRQAVSGTIIAYSTPELRLWPRLRSESSIGSKPLTVTLDASQLSHLATLHALNASGEREARFNPFDDDDDDENDGDELQSALDPEAVLGPKELEIELERYLYLEDSRDEPMLKGIVVSLSLLMALCAVRAALCAVLQPHVDEAQCEEAGACPRTCAYLLSLCTRSSGHRRIRSEEVELNRSMPDSPRAHEAQATPEEAAEYLQAWLAQSRSTRFHASAAVVP